MIGQIRIIIGHCRNKIIRKLYLQTILEYTKIKGSEIYEK